MYLRQTDLLVMTTILALKLMDAMLENVLDQIPSLALPLINATKLEFVMLELETALTQYPTVGRLAMTTSNVLTTMFATMVNATELKLFALLLIHAMMMVFVMNPSDLALLHTKPTELPVMTTMLALIPALAILDLVLLLTSLFVNFQANVFLNLSVTNPLEAV